MFYQPSTPPPQTAIIQSEDFSSQIPSDASLSPEHRLITVTLATPTPPKTLPPEFATDNLPQASNQKQWSKSGDKLSLIVSGNYPHYSKQQLSQFKVSGELQKPSSNINAAKIEEEIFKDYQVKQSEKSISLPTVTPSFVGEEGAESNTRNTLAEDNKDALKKNTENNIVVEDKKNENEHNVVAQEPKASPDKIKPTPDNPLSHILAGAKSLGSCACFMEN